MPMRIAVGIGSNVGDSREEIRLAFEFLSALSEEPPVFSSLYTSAPVDCPPGSQEFINAAAVIDCRDGVRYLLTRFKEYESGRGRDAQAIRNAPRPIDLDILYAADMEVQLPDLIIPHPRLSERLFVLEPLAEIEPEIVIPGLEKKVKLLLEEARGQYPDQQCRKIE
jgi:2-amino-4-hydroxy-6-hydroxymethyldihydropteridine diphosphokinase